ncbi:SDR family NAD(P)-dependent oxidoreductase [Cyclobacterium plantarum]|uniref:SDR family oxidoreductase n=1 Tax=Cyclobacterium plantarum TaxID=2716263 RepID=A0ABX0HGU4_9BACT|nr:SDR family oxidoreductase [Cyclobacterium plantarum]NHE59341.1 SDR family oxidoreductase [Cyclobacterium plantarum]
MKKIKSALKVCGILITNFPRLIRLAPKILTSGGHLSINVTYVKYEELLNDKRIIVTGGGSGIGLAIAQKALDLGAVVLITGRNFHKLERVANTISNPNLRILAWDVSETEKLSSHLTEAKEILGGEVDILVNNAGVLSKGLFPNVKEEDWEQVYDINSKGLFFLTQEICRIWLKQNTSTSSVKKVINISSQGGYVGATYPYRMTKWDIAGLTQGLGISLAPKNIIVNGIAPGIISTEMQKKFLKQRDNSYCDLNPQNRIASPEEIAELAAFLLSDASNFIVGQTIICDGGFSLK